MRVQLSRIQYTLLSRYCEELSKAVALANVVGFFLPSVLPSAIKPSFQQFTGGVFTSLTFLILAAILIEKGQNG